MSPTTRPRPSTFLRALALAAVAAAVLLPARGARAQACCAAAGLTAPTRLRSYEDFAAGMQGRARTVTGSFDERGGYTASGAGESELDFEQDLFAVARVLGRGQLALVIPFVQTHRAIPGPSAGASDARWGGGIGDIALSARYDFIASGERSIPGLAVLAGLVVPTGTPPEDAGDPLAAGATGQGSVEGSLGVGIEQAIEPYFLSGVALIALRSPRTVAGTRESFAPRLTGTVAAGRVLPHGATLGVFTSALWQGNNSDDRGAIPGSSVALWTAGLAGTVALSDHWRLQSTAFGDLPIGGLGRNQTTGFGGSLSVMKLWL